MASFSASLYIIHAHWFIDINFVVVIFIYSILLLTREYILMYKENSFYNYSRKRYSTMSLSIRWLQKSFKKVVENSQIYLDCIAKPRTFAPAFWERDGLTIDILLKFKASENKKQKKLRKKFGSYLKKSLSLHPLSLRKQRDRSHVSSFKYW